MVVAAAAVGACADAERAQPPDGATRIEIDASSGDRLAAVEMGSGEVGVVLAHGASTRKELWYPLMEELAAAGLHAIAFDFAGVGESDGSGSGDRTRDVRAVADYLTQNGATQIVLVGSSLGATTVLDVASDADFAGVVTFSTPGRGSWSVSEPGLYIASEGDGNTADIAEELAREFSGTARVVDGNTHGASLLDNHPEVGGEVIAFIRASTNTS